MSNANGTVDTATDVRPVDDLPVAAEGPPVDNPDECIPNANPLYSWQAYKPTALDHVRLFFYNTQLRVQRLLRQLHRKLPRLVWYGDEIDVKIMFPKVTYPKQQLVAEPVNTNGCLTVQTQYAMDEVGTASAALHKAGIGFDTGFGALDSGEFGREWFLDYSLRGPIRVKFIGKAKAPMNRTE